MIEVIQAAENELKDGVYTVDTYENIIHAKIVDYLQTLKSQSLYEHILEARNAYKDYCSRNI